MKKGDKLTYFPFFLEKNSKLAVPLTTKGWAMEVSSDVAKNMWAINTLSKIDVQAIPDKKN